MIAEEREATILVGRDELLQEDPAEQLREHADGEEEVRLARDPAGRRPTDHRRGRSCERADGGSSPSPRCAARM